MGFSTSGSLLVIFFASFVALGTFYTATSNTTDDISAASGEQFEQQNAIFDTDVDVVVATWNVSEERLTVSVDNDGTSTLSLDNTDLLVDGVYIDGWQDEATVDGEITDLWAPGERISIRDSEIVPESIDEVPERIVLVTETGVKDASAVEVED